MNILIIPVSYDFFAWYKSMLQCDRACEGAEIPISLSQVETFGLLQCDRACEGAEIGTELGARSPLLNGFNVTAPVKARK